MNIILLEFRSGWLSVSFSSIALSSSSKIITNRDFRDLSFERISFLLYLCSNRRSPLGLRELKPEFADLGQQPIWSRSPLGLRELKHPPYNRLALAAKSQPAWAAWIETIPARCANTCLRVAARLGCVNWNSSTLQKLENQALSQPAWAAWIETKVIQEGRKALKVAARLGCVNWNSVYARSRRSNSWSQPAWAAWIETQKIILYQYQQYGRSPLGLRELKLQRVDLSNHFAGRSPLGLRELKLREKHRLLPCLQVAARLGCVNWNGRPHYHMILYNLSQPAWAAWIETWKCWNHQGGQYVAARLGCVNQC